MRDPHLMSFNVPGRTLGVVLVLVIAAAWLANIGHRVLQHPDEGRYAEIAREMAVTGDWVTPRLNGLKYFEKPPLQYWLTAATFDLFGTDEWTARLWPVLAGLGAVAAMAWAGAAIGGAAMGWSAGVALAGMLWQVALSQILTLDALLSALLALAFAAFVVAQQPQSPPAKRRICMWVAWAAMAGATLTKGLIGVVIPGAALVLYTVVTRDFALWRRLHLASGTLLYLLLTVPWFVAVSLANPEFARFFFVHEHFQRFLTTEHRRTGSLWYFVPLLAVGAMPWLTLLAANLVRAWRDGVPNAIGFSWERLAIVWAAFVFVFFSASSSKLPSYILPMFPPLALVVGALVVRLPMRSLWRSTLPIAVVAIVLFLLALAAYPEISAPFADDKQPSSALLSFGLWIRLSLASAAMGGIIALWCFRREGAFRRFAGVAALSLATLFATQWVVAGLDSFRATRSAYDILQAAARKLPDARMLYDPAIPFFQVRMYDQTVPFYLRRTTTVVEFSDELALGIAADPGRAVTTVAGWVDAWSRLPQAFAIMSPEEQQQLAAAGVPMTVLATDVRRAIVSRR